MQWLNLKTSTLHAPEYIGSEPRARAAWLNVMLWCAQQENGGRIEQARDWKDRQWQQTCGVTRREVDCAERLLQWDGEALKVWNYPADKEHIVREKRDIGRAGGIKSGVARSTKSEPKGEAETKQTLQPNGQPNASTEGKGKEGKGKETYIAPAKAVAVGELVLDCPFPPESESKPSVRNETIDALAGCGGADPLQIPRSAWSGIGKALAEIKAVCPNVNPAEIGRRSANYRTHMSPDTILTPHALAKNWALCDKPNPRAPKPAQESEFSNAF
jgi:hypothetical protein